MQSNPIECWITRGPRKIVMVDDVQKMSFWAGRSVIATGLAVIPNEECHYCAKAEREKKGIYDAKTPKIYGKHIKM